MNNIPLTIIGTSRITEHHIISAQKNGFKIIALSSTREKSNYLEKLSKKFNIKKNSIILKNIFSIQKKSKMPLIL